MIVTHTSSRAPRRNLRREGPSDIIVGVIMMILIIGYNYNCFDENDIGSTANYCDPSKSKSERPLATILR